MPVRKSTDAKVSYPLTFNSITSGGDPWTFKTASASPASNENGTITTSTANATLTGSSTFFKDYSPGDRIYTTAGVYIGTINTISSDTSATFTTNSASNNSGVNFRIRRKCIKWTNNLLLEALDTTATPGNVSKLSLSCPTSGTITKNEASRTTVYVDSTNGIPLGQSEALWYNYNTGGYLIVNSNSDSSIVQNAYWVLIAIRFSDDTIRLGNGSYFSECFLVSANGSSSAAVVSGSITRLPIATVDTSNHTTNVDADLWTGGASDNGGAYPRVSDSSFTYSFVVPSPGWYKCTCQVTMIDISAVCYLSLNIERTATAPFSPNVNNPDRGFLTTVNWPTASAPSGTNISAYGDYVVYASRGNVITAAYTTNHPATANLWGYKQLNFLKIEKIHK